ncbi:hypothetical protein ACC689_36205, partial [Rhizobium ruizarguesonis]
IGFLVVLPFLVIDLIVATITMAIGMMILPPTSISLPFKILFFVLIDCWNLLVGLGRDARQNFLGLLLGLGTLGLLDLL